MELKTLVSKQSPLEVSISQINCTTSTHPIQCYKQYIYYIKSKHSQQKRTKIRFAFIENHIKHDSKQNPEIIRQPDEQIIKIKRQKHYTKHGSKQNPETNHGQDD